MIHLDTHAALFLHAGLRDEFTPEARKRISEERKFISPMVALEMDYLYEIDRISESSEPILNALRADFSVEIDQTPFEKIVRAAASMRWTRDPFDRLITAAAAINDVVLVTKDEVIRRHYPLTLR